MPRSPVSALTRRHRVERLAVEPLGLVGHPLARILGVGGAAVPDLGRDAARLDRDHLDPPGPELGPQAVADRLERELGGAVGPHEGGRDEAADRGDVDDPALVRAQHRQHRLGHGDVADQVDLELLADVVEVEELERPRVGAAGVVDERRRARAPRVRSRIVSAAASIWVGVGDVEQQRLELAVRLRLHRLAVLGLADAGEDREAATRELQRRRPADAARGARDERRAWSPPQAARAGCEACSARRRDHAEPLGRLARIGVAPGGADRVGGDLDEADEVLLA